MRNPQFYVSDKRPKYVFFSLKTLTPSTIHSYSVFLKMSNFFSEFGIKWGGGGGGGGGGRGAGDNMAIVFKRSINGNLTAIDT